MKTQTLAAAGLLALAALVVLPTPAAADGPTVTICGPCIPNCTPASGGGGVIGATVTYANQEKAVACGAATGTAAVAVGAALSACDATTHYAVGSSCSLVCTCPAPVIDLKHLLDISMAESANAPATAQAAASSPTSSVAWVGPQCAQPAPSSGGVVGDTVHYGATMAAIGCNAALGEGNVLGNAFFATCDNTGVYLTGQPTLCARPL